jgi:hypothetical protein
VKPVRSLVADLGLLGLAVIFGWAIWYTVREDLNETWRRPVEIVFRTDGDLDVSPRTQTVTVLFQGPRRAIDALRAMPTPRVVRQVASAEIAAGTAETRLDLPRDRFDFAESLGGNALTALDMDPPAVTVKLYRVEKRKVTVAPPDFQGAADLGVRHLLLGRTDEATVRGRQTDFATFRGELRTLVTKEQLQAYVESLKDSPKTTVTINVEIDPAQRDVFTLIEPKQLVARVELSRVAEQELVVPIEVFETRQKGGRPARHLQFAELNKPHFVPGDPPRVKLVVTGAPSALAALSASRVHAFVLGSDLADDQRNGDVPVHVADLPSGVALAMDYSVYVEETR